MLLVFAGYIGELHFGYLPALRVCWEALPDKPLLMSQILDRVSLIHFVACFCLSFMGSVGLELTPVVVRLRRVRRYHRLHGETWHPLWDRIVAP